MVTLRDLHSYQTARRLVQLEDGRIGKIVRVDTTFPGNRTIVSVYTVGPAGNSDGAAAEPLEALEPSDRGGRAPEKGPGIARVTLERVIGLAKESA